FLSRSAVGDMALIQVCADPSDSATLAREVRALLEAATQFPTAKCQLLTLFGDITLDKVPAAIEVLPIYQWVQMKT
ncbi:MAG TPA: hypothetical protein VGS41_18470, partial [Chthonomonadales bacterium]|nr:hypothetical protein [Chthonomonadales bacterium]